MFRKPAAIALAGMIAATLVVPSIAGATTTTPNPARYDSTPAKGTVTVPSIGAEAYSFNRVGNEVLLRPHTAQAIKHVSVTMVSWACETGAWNTGCTTTPGAKFRQPITLELWRYSHTNPTTGEITPGKRLAKITKTFNIRYRPSSASATEPRYIGADGLPHNGIAQTIAFPITTKLPNDVVWTVSYNTRTSGPNPVGASSPADSLNVGLSPATTIGHDRFPGSIMWDTRYAPFAHGAPFVTGELNLDHGWHGYVPAARFSVR